MAQVTARDHAYDPDPTIPRAPTVPLSLVATPPQRSGIRPLPTSLVYTPPSPLHETPGSAISPGPSLPNSASSAHTNFSSYRFGSSPASSPNTGIFARRGSLLPRSGESYKSTVTPGRSGRMEEQIELSPVKLVVVDEAKVREEQAMAKWRKWVVEHPAQSTLKPMPSPLRQKPLHTIINMSPDSSPRQSRQGSAISNHKSERSPSEQRSEPGPSKRPSRTNDDNVIFNTESVLALRDVELAIDENILNQSEGRSRLGSRRMSVVPPPYPESNPFYDIAPRLASRRVRPLVVEFIQALGHFIDAVWSMAHPDKMCPWVESDRTLERKDSNQPDWTSRMLTAVAEGKKDGHVAVPITARDLRFWEGEVKYCLKDVSAVVGIYKGVAYAFDTAMAEGMYGEVHKENVITSGEHEGGLTRLLHDLEEAMWGEAAPRCTDLAYELPEDFDPYDRIENEQANSRPTPSPNEKADPMATAGASQTNGSNLAAPTSEGLSVPEKERRVMTINTWDAALNLDAFKMDGEEEVSLEELGRRRHQEWLESRKADGWDV